MKYALEVPALKLVSLANVRWHWARKAKYAKAVRAAVYLAVAEAGLLDLRLARCRLKIVRKGPRVLDTDNLYASAKPVLDALKPPKCDPGGWHLIPEDDPAHVELTVEQKRGEYAVEIVVEGR